MHKISTTSKTVRLHNLIMLQAHASSAPYRFLPSSVYRQCYPVTYLQCIETHCCRILELIQVYTVSQSIGSLLHYTDNYCHQNLHLSVLYRNILLRLTKCSFQYAAAFCCSQLLKSFCESKAHSDCHYITHANHSYYHCPVSITSSHFCCRI